MTSEGLMVSSQTVIRRVLRDSGIEEDFAWLDATEWIVEVLDLIDCPKSFVNDLEIVTVSDYKATLPCGYRDMIQCSGSLTGKGWFPMNYSTNTFHPTTDYSKVNKQAGGTNISSYTTWNNIPITIGQPISYDAQGNPVFQFGQYTTYSLDKFSYMPIIPAKESWGTYKLGDGVVHTNFQEGFLYLAFKKYPVDCDGFPLIPDHESFKQALQWHVQYKVDYKKWRMKEIDDKTFQYSEQQRLWYVAQAATKGKMPNLDEMESWKNMLRQPIILDNHHKTGYINLQRR
tara:strand:+ start:282 stop:1142 length:861 start_codon:yes stop_codon:yes gene_type:complete